MRPSLRLAQGVGDPRFEVRFAAPPKRHLISLVPNRLPGLAFARLPRGDELRYAGLLRAVGVPDLMGEAEQAGGAFALAGSARGPGERIDHMSDPHAVVQPVLDFQGRPAVGLRRIEPAAPQLRLREERLAVGSHPSLAMLVAACPQLLEPTDDVVDLAAEDVRV